MSLGILQKDKPIDHRVLQCSFCPLITNGDPLYCRFGVNANQTFDNYQIDDLPIGWYVNYQAMANPERPNGASYALIISLTQTGPNANDYDYNPDGADLIDAIAGNPGADWFIGNEPDRRHVQDDIEPHVYAAVYHELYTLIKTADPTARIFAGTIVQPTPLRLQYLDMILASYEQQQGGASFPADGWSIHNFILNEASCDYPDSWDNCWGAEIPPGIDAHFGEFVAIDDIDNINIFQQRLVDFRQWMFDNGYRNLPLTVSEYGFLLPGEQFPSTRVNAFMNASVNYMLTATDPVLGDPHDGNRLVQTWSWYSTGIPNDPFNGYLFEGTVPPWPLSSMGVNYADLIAQQSKEIDYYPTAILSETVTLSSSVTITLEAIIANSGNTVKPTRSVTVRFYDGDPQIDGTPIGTEQFVSLPGCGYHQPVTVTWSDVPSGNYTVFVEVDADHLVTETDEANNVMSVNIDVAGTQ